MKRYTARVESVGFLRLSRYDELERETSRHQWRLVRVWEESAGGLESRSAPDDGVKRIARPLMSADVKSKLLISARAQLEWAKEENT